MDFGICHNVKNINHIRRWIHSIPDKVRQMEINPFVEKVNEREYFKYIRHNIAGSLFSGSKDNLLEYSNLFRKKLDQILMEGWHQLDEAIMTLISKENPDLFDHYYGDYQNLVSGYDSFFHLDNNNIIKLIFDGIKKCLDTFNHKKAYHILNYLKSYCLYNQELSEKYVYNYIICNYYINKYLDEDIIELFLTRLLSLKFIRSLEGNLKWYHNYSDIEKYKYRNVSFYYLSREGTERDIRMVNRFNLLNIPTQRVDWMDNDWLISKGYETFSCMWGHIKMIKEFLASGKEYGIFFEDDVYIRKSLLKEIDIIITKIEEYQLDVLLLGYLINHSPLKSNNFNLFKGSGNIYEYHDELWGSQSYVLTRKHAKYIIDEYNEEYLDALIESEYDDKKIVPFAPDWTITKDGKRAIVYPMYAVEEGNINTDHQDQINFHRSCFEFNYNSGEFW